MPLSTAESPSTASKLPSRSANTGGTSMNKVGEKIFIDEPHFDGKRQKIKQTNLFFKEKMCTPMIRQLHLSSNKASKTI